MTILGISSCVVVALAVGGQLKSGRSFKGSHRSGAFVVVPWP